MLMVKHLIHLMRIHWIQSWRPAKLVFFSLSVIVYAIDANMQRFSVLQDYLLNDEDKEESEANDKFADWIINV